MTKSPLENSKGTLSLTGSGEYLPGMDPVDKMLLERVGTAPRVVCLPTAAAPDGASIVRNWARMGVEHFTKLGAQAESLDILTHKDANNPALADKLREANFVYLSGGKPEYLHEVLKGSLAFAALNDILSKGGVVAGCSAGAMIWGEKIPSFPTLIPLHDVFNYLPGSIIMPHFDEFGDRWGGALKLAMGERTILGIDGFTALVCQQGNYHVAGKSAVTVWDKKQKVRYTHGQSLTWGKPI
jgi:cyanophycinase-like exopeptidase